jgi:hypothetical protein
MFNRPINVVCKILNNVMASATEAETGRLFINGQEAAYERQILEELGHPQPRTPIETDNASATGIANDTVQQK